MEGVLGTDDLFADSSTETVKENVINDGFSNDGLCVNEELKNGFAANENTIPNSESAINGSVIAIQVIEDYCKPSHIVYCPFCPMSYTNEQLLKNHLKDFHNDHMNLIFSDDNPFVTFQSCTLCYAKFYTRGLLPLHLLKKHENALIGLINCRNVKCDNLLYCMYCDFTVLKKNSKILMLHLEKMHFSLFENFVCDNYAVNVNAKEVLSSFHDQKKFVHYSSSLNRPIKRVSFSSRGINSSARRKLDFNSIEHSKKIRFRSYRKEKSYAENFITIHKKRAKEKNKFTKWLVFGRKQKTIPIITSTPKIDQILSNDINVDEESSFEFMQFRCASCYQTFRTNAELLSHVSQLHKWPWNRLRPCYSCGFCDARFYRNSFLIRHTINHHTPKCLKIALDD